MTLRQQSHVHHLHIVCLSHAHHMHITCTLQAHHMHITCTSHTHHIHITCKSLAHHMHIKCASHVHHMHIACTSLAHHMHIKCTSHVHHMHITYITCTSHAHHMHITCTSHHKHPIHLPQEVAKIVVGPGVLWVVQNRLPQVKLCLVSLQKGTQVIVRTGMIRRQPGGRRGQSVTFTADSTEGRKAAIRSVVVTIATTELIHALLPNCFPVVPDRLS